MSERSYLRVERTCTAQQSCIQTESSGFSLSPDLYELEACQ